MLGRISPMGWNSWNTFSEHISEKLICEMADCLLAEGYYENGYKYVIIDDCWQQKERDEDGNLVPDPEKFPNGIKAVADYLHERGLKLGIYSCAGILTCAGYPGSYDHEFQDARTFASWGIDYLKYDFCNFPKNADGKNRYLIMSMALKSCGRDIFFAACNWGKENSWNWMKSIGAHSFRSTGDIFDNFRSFTSIFMNQFQNLAQSGTYCHNDLDMLTVGMYNKGHVALGRPCTDTEYRMQFAMWCLAGSPLIIGADIRTLNKEMKSLLLNRELIRIAQDEECRPPFKVGSQAVHVPIPEEEREDAIDPLMHIKEQRLTFLKFLSNHEFVIAYFNMYTTEQEMLCFLSDAGIPYHSNVRIDMKEVFTGEECKGIRDFHKTKVEGHSCKIYHCKFSQEA